ncbi:hypothetical protein HMPREF2678_05415 [Corynebacterium sp. HMSC058E07]|nr:hypothetical protein HMPREF2678_05415 [Corynebacterium sp. HMSC058E07]
MPVALARPRLYLSTPHSTTTTLSLFRSIYVCQCDFPHVITPAEAAALGVLAVIVLIGAVYLILGFFMDQIAIIALAFLLWPELVLWVPELAA